MKKYILILLVVLSLFTLAACSDDEIDNETAITASFSDASINQNTISISLTVDDPNNEITGTIYAKLYNDNDEQISSRSFTKNTGDHALDGVTITFAALGLEQAYHINVEITVERDVIIVERYDFQTVGTIHITTVEEFLAMDDYRGADYVLDNDLDFTGVDFVTPFDNTYFSGTFDGQGYTLSNINITTSTSTTSPERNYYYIGVFGYMGSAATLSNLNVDHVTIGSAEEPQQLDNLARIGFLVGYAGSTNVEIENVSVSNSHFYLTSATEEYAYVGGIVGDLKGSLNGATITNSSITLTTTNTDNDQGFLVRMGGAVGFAEVDSEVHEVYADIDLNYQTTISEFGDGEGLKVVVGGVIGDKIASENSNDVSDVFAIGDINVDVDLVLTETFTSGTYTLYVGGLIGYTSLKITDGMFAGSIDVNHVSKDADTGINKQFYIGGLVGNYETSYALKNVVWVVVGDGLTMMVADDVNWHADSLIAFERKTPDHIYGVIGTENVVINDVVQDATAPIIADMTDYFSSDYGNDIYSNYIANLR